MSVQAILRKIGLQMYYERFIDHGFNRWDLLIGISDTDMASLGMKLGHMRKLQREVATCLGYPLRESLDLFFLSLTRGQHEESGTPLWVVTNDTRRASQYAEEKFDSSAGLMAYRPSTFSHGPDLDLGLSLDLLTQVCSSSAPFWSSHTFEYQTSCAYQPAPYSQELVGNSLNLEAALHMLSSVGAVHHHPDEPWHHMLGVSRPDVVSTSQGNGVVGPQLRSDMMAELGSVLVGSTGDEEFDVGHWAWYGPFG